MLACSDTPLTISGPLTTSWYASQIKGHEKRSYVSQHQRCWISQSMATSKIPSTVTLSLETNTVHLWSVQLHPLYQTLLIALMVINGLACMQRCTPLTIFLPTQIMLYHSKSICTSSPKSSLSHYHWWIEEHVIVVNYHNMSVCFGVWNCDHNLLSCYLQLAALHLLRA